MAAYPVVQGAIWHVGEGETMAAHEGTVELGACFAGVHAWVAERGGVRVITRQGAPYDVVAADGRRGVHAQEPLLRFLRDGVESSRAYACCWGHTYNCYGASIGSGSRALDALIQATPAWHLEEAALALLREHAVAPYARLNQAEARAALAAAWPDETAISSDDQPVRLVHLGYPAGFGLNPKRPTRRVARGEGEPVRYDVAVLRPETVRRARAEALLRGEAGDGEGDSALQAVAQVVLDDRGLGKQRVRASRRALQVLRLADGAEARMLVVLVRYRRNTLKAWERDWPRLAEALEGAGVRVAASVHWLALGAAAEQAFWGRWLHPVAGDELGRLPRRVLGTSLDNTVQA